jgi:hypothetical protein
VDNLTWMSLFTGGGLVIVLLIFGGALWFVNRARKGNLRFAWRQKRAQRARHDPDATQPSRRDPVRGAGRY